MGTKHGETKTVCDKCDEQIEDWNGGIAVRIKDAYGNEKDYCMKCFKKVFIGE